MQMTRIVQLAAYGVGPEGCWTIDASTTDNGYLACARAGYPQADRHSDTRQAIANLSGRLPAGGTANIVGHGYAGLVVTGTGQIVNWADLRQFISNRSIQDWQQYFLQLKGQAAIIRLMACHPGTGQAGLDLLNELCKASGAVCMGPTGFVYCGGGAFTLESNSTWQVVCPGQPLPAPIGAPTPFFKVMATDMEIRTSAGYETVAIEQVRSIELLSADGSRTLASIRSDTAQTLARAIGFEVPFFVDGAPAAIMTGRIRVYFGSSAARTLGESREYLIWNDLQIEDAENRGHFYPVQSDFGTLIRMLQ